MLARRAQLTRHLDAIGEEVAGICDENDEAALNLGRSSDVGEFEAEGRNNSNDNSNDQASEEYKQE
jgi:hypothetical protein